jgi:hypothetical protein
MPLTGCCDLDVTTRKLDGSPKDSRAKPLCELTPIKQCFFYQHNHAQTREPFLIPKCPLFDTMKIRRRFCPHGGAKREFINGSCHRN